MAAFGEDGFGEHLFGIPRTNINDADDYWNNDGIAFNEHTETYKLERALTAELDRTDADLRRIGLAHHIDTAEGEQLERFAELVQLKRKAGESDDKFRSRIKLQFSVSSIGGTFDQFSQLAARVLNTDIEDLTFELPYEKDPAVVRMSLDQTVLDNTNLTDEEVVDLLGRAVPASHEVQTVREGTFLVKADGASDDASNGLTSDSIDTGGTLTEDLA